MENHVTVITSVYIATVLFNSIQFHLTFQFLFFWCALEYSNSLLTTSTIHYKLCTQLKTTYTQLNLYGFLLRNLTNITETNGLVTQHPSLLFLYQPLLLSPWQIYHQYVPHFWLSAQPRWHSAAKLVVS